MSETNTIDLILQALARIESKVDAQAVENSKIGERIAALEAGGLLYDTQLRKLQDDVAALSDKSNRSTGGLQVAAWIIATGLALAGLLLK